MSALPIIITTAGLNALPNAQNTGVSNVVIASMGVSPTQIAATAATNAIPGEVKRIAGVSGQVVADDQIYVSAADQTEDTYVVRTIGLYLDTGVLFAVYSQAAPLLEKAGPAMAVLEAAIKLSSPQADAIEFSGGGWLNPQASETVQGVLRLASEAEAKAGTNTTRAVTPKGLKGAIDVVVTWINQEFNGIAQALAGKAAVAHTHVLGDITGLVAALNAKAAAAHTHVMGDITGLVDALNGKAAAIHTHAMSSIDGLTNALAGKAAAAHLHAMADISGLAEAFAGKAAAAHTHPWDQVTGKPSLARTDTTDVLLGAHATGMVVQINGSPWRALAPLNTPIFEGGAGAEGGEVRLKRPTTETSLSDDVVIDVYQNRVRIFENANPLRGAWIDLTSCAPGIAAQIWHSSNFNPADKAAALHSHSWEQITGKPSLATTDGTAVFLGAHATGMAVRINGSDWRHLAPLNTPVFEGGLGPEGGEIRLKRPTSETTLSDDVVIDLYQNRLRIFENSNPLRGAWLDLSALTAGIGAQLLTDAVARNLGSPGYAVIPGTGLMMQWGVFYGSIPEGFTQATLPTAFGGGCLVAMAIPRNGGGVVTADWYMQMGGKYLDRLVFYANRANGGTGSMDGFEWLAIGRVSGAPDPAYSSGGGGGGGGGGEIDPHV